MQGDLSDLLHRPNVFPQESGEAGKGSVKGGPVEGLNHRGGMNFFPQLDKAGDKGREDFERRS